MVKKYFSLFYKNDETFLKSSFHLDYFDEQIASIILITNESNFIKFSQLTTFGELCKKLFNRSILSLDDLKLAQFSTIKYYENKVSKESQTKLFSAFATLYKNALIDQTLHEELKSIFSFHEEKQTNKEELTKQVDAFSFHEKVDLLLNTSDLLNDIFESPALKNRVTSVKEALQNRNFSIGITGVMKAGKSTLLNALLKKEVLGTAVVPETANLSVIKYSKNSNAKVYFWTKEDWNKIQVSAQTIESMQKFVNETKEHFKNSIDDFLTQNGKTISINTDELHLYTSAITSDKKCNLVKKVEIFEELEFLKDGVSIVDTPGLDDPVIEREEITKEYLNKCDLMIHLMNCAQAATNKDVEFIIDALTYQGISRLLIVLTRIDVITKLELEEVISYTKTSIRKQLEKHNKGNLFDSILEKIEFIPVAGKLALMHRIGQSKQALKLGFTEQQTGILQLEKYLSDVLFGENSQKALLLINSNAKILFLATQDCISSYKIQSENLKKSSDELKDELENLKNINEEKRESIKNAFQMLGKTKTELYLYSQTILLETSTRTKSLSRKIFEIIFSDVKYELNKNGKKPKDERVSYFIESGIKDGILDLIRDYRFTFSKQLIEAEKKISVYFENINLHEEQNIFDVKAFFSIHKSTISSNHQVLITNVLNQMSKTSKKDIEYFGQKILTIFDEKFKELSMQLLELFEQLNQTLLNEFENKNKEPLDFMMQKMKDEEKNLNLQIELISKNESEVKKRDEILQEKISKLRILEDNLTKFGGIL